MNNLDYLFINRDKVEILLDTDSAHHLDLKFAEAFSYNPLAIRFLQQAQTDLQSKSMNYYQYWKNYLKTKRYLNRQYQASLEQIQIQFIK